MHWSKPILLGKKQKNNLMSLKFEDLKIGDRVCHDYINGLFFVVGLDNGFVDIFSIELDSLIKSCTVSILKYRIEPEEDWKVTLDYLKQHENE